MDIVIEKNVPPPTTGHGTWGSVLSRMEVGDSFVTSDTPAARGALRTAATRVKISLTIRKEVDSNGHPVEGQMRVWRAADKQKEQAE
jgi:proline racemase